MFILVLIGYIIVFALMMSWLDSGHTRGHVSSGYKTRTRNERMQKSSHKGRTQYGDWM